MNQPSHKMRQPQIQVPVPAYKIVSRDLVPTRSPRCLSASMPRGAKPAPLVSSREFTSLPQRGKQSLERFAGDLLKGTPLSRVDSSTVPQLTIILKEKKRQSLLAGDYNTSEKCDKMIAILNSLVINRKFASIQAKNVRELQTEISEAEATLTQLRAKWDQKIDQFNAQQHQSCRRLEGDQQGRLQTFDGRIPSDLPATYCKLSPTVLDLREKERHLVLTRRYDEARSLQHYTDGLEKQETLIRKEQFIKTTESDRKKLIQKQTDQATCFTQRWTRQAEQLKRDRAQEIGTQERLIQNLKMKLESAQSEHYETYN